jgi:hypothetical protein
MALRKPLVLDGASYEEIPATDSLDCDCAVTVNESGADADFRVEGDDSPNLFICNGGNDSVQIGQTNAGSIAQFFPNVITFNAELNDQDFSVRGDNTANLFIVDAGLDAVRIGTSTAGAIADFGPNMRRLTRCKLATVAFLAEY